jgi:hypothetical protein
MRLLGENEMKPNSRMPQSVRLTEGLAGSVHDIGDECD